MTTLLLARHILRTIGRQRSRTLMVWLALVAALGVVVGLLSFVSSIDDSFAERGRAIRGVSDAQVRAVGESSLDSGLVRRLERMRGTRFAVPVTQQRITLRSQRRSVVASAYGIDRSARRLRSTMQRELRVRVPRRAENGGLSLSADMARRLNVRRGDRIRLFAFQRSPRVRVARVVTVRESLADVITLPRSTLERLRGSPRRPNVIFVRLDRDQAWEGWKRRARRLLPDNATLTTPSGEQRELDEVIDLTVRSYTYMFGAVVLTIVGLLIYVLQLMRMLERQEDAGLVRALGSGSAPLARAELVVLALTLAAALVPGILVGHLLASYLADQLPSFLAEVFNFTVQVGVKTGVVIAAVGLALVLGTAATVGALATSRRPVADQLGRAPQAGATATARISTTAAAAMALGGLGGFAASLVLAGRPSYLGWIAAGVAMLGLATAGLTALLIRWLAHIAGAERRTLLVVRSALEAYPRRVAFSAAIVALGLTSVTQMQLSGYGLDRRAERLTGVIRPSSQRVLAGDDALSAVPMRQEYVRQVLREPAPKPPDQPAQSEAAAPAAAAPEMPAAARQAAQRRRRRLAAQRLRRRPLPSYAQAVALAFTTYGGRRLEVLALDAGRAKRMLRGDAGLSAGIPALRRKRGGVLISRGLAAWSDLQRGDRIRIRTASGPRRLKIVRIVDDVAWPSGTVYMDIRRYRKLYRTTAINYLAVTARRHLRPRKLRNLRPLHTISGRALAEQIKDQVGNVVKNILAMRFLTVLAAIVAVGGILATSVFARRREWGVLRAMGMPGEGLMWPLALEVLLIMLVGVAAGTVGGTVMFEGPVRSFMDSQGIAVDGQVAAAPLLTAMVGAVAAGTLAVVVPSWLVVRTRLADALSYE